MLIFFALQLVTATELSRLITYWKEHRKSHVRHKQ